jgi:hypothetical protein
MVSHERRFCFHCARHGRVVLRIWRLRATIGAVRRQLCFLIYGNSAVRSVATVHTPHPRPLSRKGRGESALIAATLRDKMDRRFCDDGAARPWRVN